MEPSFIWLYNWALRSRGCPSSLPLSHRRISWNWRLRGVSRAGLPLAENLDVLNWMSVPEGHAALLQRTRQSSRTVIIRPVFNVFELERGCYREFLERWATEAVDSKRLYVEIWFLKSSFLIKLVEFRLIKYYWVVTVLVSIHTFWCLQIYYTK